MSFCSFFKFSIPLISKLFAIIISKWLIINWLVLWLNIWLLILKSDFLLIYIWLIINTWTQKLIKSKSIAIIFFLRSCRYITLKWLFWSLVSLLFYCISCFLDYSLFWNQFTQYFLNRLALMFFMLIFHTAFFFFIIIFGIQFLVRKFWKLLFIMILKYLIWHQEVISKWCEMP